MSLWQLALTAAVIFLGGISRRNANNAEYLFQTITGLKDLKRIIKTQRLLSQSFTER